METIDFYPKTLRQIPEQDNPAYGDTECYMLVREDTPARNSMRVLVLKIDPVENPFQEEAITQIATFGDHGKAQQYCKLFDELLQLAPLKAALLAEQNKVGHLEEELLEANEQIDS